MENTIIDGKLASQEILDKIKQYFQQNPTNKKFAIISAGDDYGSNVYCKMKKKQAEYVGIGCDIFEFSKDCRQDEIESKIKELVKSDDYVGIVVQHPLPESIDEQKCLNLIPSSKDIDGLSAESFGLMAQGNPIFVPATALGIMKLFDKYNINLIGEKVLVVGKSQIVGLPLSILLMQAGATVTVAHSRTKNLEEMIKDYKIVIVAIGKSEYLKADWFAEGQIIIDAGYNDGNIGDVEKSAYKKASFYTPVPGGVGPMTIAALLEQTKNAILNFDKK